MHTPTRLLLAALGVFALSAHPAFAAGNAKAGEQKAAACMACHGVDGNSMALPAPAEPWPKLAGQLSAYIEKQVNDFKAGRRANEQMSPQAQAVLAVDIPDIAAYFAAQKIKQEEVAGANETADKAQLALGEKLFSQGKGRPEVVPACKGCHSPDGSGNRNWNTLMSTVPAVLAPAIGSQHANYLVKQLKAYRENARNNDNARVMRNIAQRLTEQEINAVAAYAATLAR